LREGELAHVLVNFFSGPPCVLLIALHYIFFGVDEIVCKHYTFHQIDDYCVFFVTDIAFVMSVKPHL